MINKLFFYNFGPGLLQPCEEPFFIKNSNNMCLRYFILHKFVYSPVARKSSKCGDFSGQFSVSEIICVSQVFGSVRQRCNVHVKTAFTGAAVALGAKTRYLKYEFSAITFSLNKRAPSV